MESKVHFLNPSLIISGEEQSNVVTELCLSNAKDIDSSFAYCFAVGYKINSRLQLFHASVYNLMTPLIGLTLWFERNSVFGLR